jgi:glycyl-tRNA synthetase beta chain
MTHNNLLVELFVEELPPKALKKLGDSFGAALLDGLRAQGLAGEASALTGFATPRRLAALVTHVAAKATDRAVQVKLMPVAVGLDAAGTATPALLKKLQAAGLDASVVPNLKRVSDGKADVLFADSVVAGATLQVGLQKALDDAIAKLPIPKVMNYQLADGWTSVDFVRPAHSLVALHGADVVPVTALGLTAGRFTRGHRFEAKVECIEIANADVYEASLESQGAVVPSYAKRRALIESQLNAAAAKAGAGLKPIADEALLDEVNSLVERPNVLICQFEPQFLAVPQECLILTMKANQKYFPLLDASGALTEKFLVVSNISPSDASAVIEGNEKVVRPRLADAKFFFDQDRKTKLEDRIPKLAKVVYHNKLGSQGERTERVRAIARSIGKTLGGDVLAARADRAALLAKADLLTDMVGEFPELQGIMGGYYARHDGEHEDIAFAVEDHYKPRFAGDDLPRGQAGLVVALADKLETLVGMFGIGNLPTGDKDPFALRRHALGVLRMLMEKALPLSLPALVDAAYAAFGDKLPADGPDAAKAKQALLTFVYERLGGVLRDAGYSAQEVDAVIEVRPPWGEFATRLAAVRSFAQLSEAPALAAANKRVNNILKKAEAAVEPKVDAKLLELAEEKDLFNAIENIAKDALFMLGNGQFEQNLKLLASLKVPVDVFFDKVMVNAEDSAVRANRLGLLATLHRAMNQVADLSKLAS